jgi:hypothetical protein
MAQYWGQTIAKHERDNKNEIREVSSTLDLESMGWYLELKSVSDISDEDAIEIAKMFTLGIEREFIVLKNGFYKTFVSWGESRFEKLLIDDAVDKQKTVDYLRSKGYALPYDGLSVEKQIEYNWIKLI